MLSDLELHRRLARHAHATRTSGVPSLLTFRSACQSSVHHPSPSPHIARREFSIRNRRGCRFLRSKIAIETFIAEELALRGSVAVDAEKGQLLHLSHCYPLCARSAGTTAY